MTTFRFAVWAAVSTEEQVRKQNKVTGVKDEKYSLRNQIQQCREYAASLGGVETAGPFVADGYSRADYEGLTEAMADIPDLKRAVESAARNEFDVLIVRYFDRLGSFDKMLFTRFKKLKKQLRSVQEQTPILPPGLYNPLKDSSTLTQIQIAGITQEGRMDRIKLMRSENMPHRIAEGLPPGVIPRGYEFVSSKAPARQVPAECAKLLQAKQMLFDGQSYISIADFLGVSHNSVKEILANPYYAGIVAFNKRITQFVGDKKRRVYTDSADWITGQGKHVPLWSVEEHREILAEIDRRAEVTKRNKPTHAFMGLLRCGTCGAYLKLRQKWSPRTVHRYLICRIHGVGHVGYRYDDLYDVVTKAVQEKIRQAEHGETMDEEDNREEMYARAIADKQKKRRKIQEGFESDLYSAAEASKLIRENEQEIARLQRDIERVRSERLSRRNAAKSIQAFGSSAEKLPLVLKHSQPAQINALLRAWIRDIEIWNKGKVKVNLR